MTETKKNRLNLRGDRKYFAIVFFIIILILLTGIITPRLIEYKRAHWSESLSAKITQIENLITTSFSTKETFVLSKKDFLKSELRKTLNPRNNSYGALIQLVNGDEFNGLSLEILAPNGKLIAWNESIAVPQNDILPLAYPAGETHFYNSNLVSYLTVTDTVLIENDQFYFVVSLPLERNYKLQNHYYKEINFSQDLSNKFLTQVKVDYSQFSEGSKDGRQYSFALLNNYKHKIGEVSFFKPTIDSNLSLIYEDAGKIQSLLAVLGFLLVIFGFRKDFSELKYRSVKFLILSTYLIAFRIILFYVGIPSTFLDGALVDPAYFSSIFAGGIVKSPIEFFITNFFFLLICIIGYKYLIDFITRKKHSQKYNLLKFSLLFIPVSFIIFLTIRGLSASIKSVIFDSTLRYFKEPNLLPNLPSMIMNMSMLMLGVSAVLFIIGLLVYLFGFLSYKNKRTIRVYILSSFILFEVLSYLFILNQHEPLITPFLGFVFVLLLVILFFRIYYSGIKSVYNFIFITLVASIIVITLMNYFNVSLEKTSLKTTALEINRSNDNLLKFLISETLESAAADNNLAYTFANHNANFDATAFLIWSKSSLQKESLGSSITIYDRNRKKVGGFEVGINDDTKPKINFNKVSTDKPLILEAGATENSINRTFTGIIPIEDEGVLVGYISASISFNMQNLGAINIPDFLESNSNIINSVIDVKRLKIFEFSNKKLVQVFGDIYPSRDQIKPILNRDLSPDNEAWITLPLNGINFTTYIVKTDNNGSERIISVSLKEKSISWELFNFFKIFIVHTLIILALLFLLLLFNLRNLKFSFRAQLLIAFLFISILPVVILAVYNRQVVKQRSQDAIFNELSERSRYVEKHINEEVKENKTSDYAIAFNNAGKDLGISFAVYDMANQIYNSKDQYYKAGLFNNKLDPEVYYEMNYLSYREYLTQEKIDNFIYDAYYKKINLNGREFILGVNDAFNKVRLTFSVIDIDVFLFGIYSFATLIIILLSTMLANRISAPIRKLTNATSAVAHGDLNVEIQNREIGEIKDLITGFNMMTKELKKNQVELAELERENAWKEMAKQVAHEIKNPLTPMKLAVQQLIVSYRDKRDNFDNIFEKVSTTILSQIENLSTIASEFSRFARMPNYNLEEIDLIPIINDTLNLFIEERIKIKFNTEIDEAIIEGDKSQVRRMFINLIRNSIQAGAKNVEIINQYEQDHFIITVSDDGGGIPEQVRSKIFEANFTTKVKGMGIGLKLTKRFLEGIKGNIRLVESGENGTKFKIEIPSLKNKVA